MDETTPEEMYGKFRAQMQAGKSVIAFYIDKDNQIEVDIITAPGTSEYNIRKAVAWAAHKTAEEQ